MKITYGCFEKGHGTHKKKKKQIVFKNKIEIDVPNINFFSGVYEFCFTDMKTIL